MKNLNVGIIGAGNMGEAIIKGLLKQTKFNVCVHDKNGKRLNLIYRRYRVKKITLARLIKTSRIIIICVKPQDIDELLKNINASITSKHLIISIAAGVTTKHLEKAFKSKPAVVRVMPNLPGLVGQGVSAYCLGKNASSRNAKDTETIFKTMGKVLKTKENKMNAITAISGSGPGFMAYFMAALEEAALDIGLNKKEARFLSVYATSGTANMVVLENIDPSKLVSRVASKGGTTEAGLKELKIKSKVKNAARAATKRAKQLSKK